ncbi:hypothetical protein [Desulfotomaculum copahuensis]|uniref:Uncharacterized protein n=1 Tax=Desulfotomaculum copahuensis TaxID=1838280 RepID=A0A1B7LAI3_9FIRM|nr:hypothetical protein [Desulfotomaculum copahuensis]OAT79342.1 hypothetical protein A6M21_15940 [Desulfotomaculum copahuensis]
MHLGLLALIVCLGNIPFGYWRSNVVKFSTQWFLAVHVPVPFIILLRVFSGIGWAPVSFPVLIGAFFSGQYAGGRLKIHLKSKSPVWSSSCLIRDTVRALQDASGRGGAID